MCSTVTLHEGEGHTVVSFDRAVPVYRVPFLTGSTLGDPIPFLLPFTTDTLTFRSVTTDLEFLQPRPEKNRQSGLRPWRRLVTLSTLPLPRRTHLPGCTSAPQGLSVVGHGCWCCLGGGLQCGLIFRRGWFRWCDFFLFLRDSPVLTRNFMCDPFLYTNNVGIHIIVRLLVDGYFFVTKFI